MRKSSAIPCIISQHYPLLDIGKHRINVTRNYVCGFYKISLA